MTNINSEEAKKRIAEIDKEFNEIKKRAQHLKNIRTERQQLQPLLETRERNQKVQQARKRQAEIMKQINKELHKIHQAQQTVIQALQKIEPLKWEPWNLQQEYHELNFMGFIIPTPVKKFTYSGAVSTKWAKL